MDNFDGKTLLITGGIGSFGHAVLNKFLKSKIKEIRIFQEMKRNKKILDTNYNLIVLNYLIKLNSISEILEILNQ